MFIYEITYNLLGQLFLTASLSKLSTFVKSFKQVLQDQHNCLFLTSYPKLQKNDSTCSHIHLEIDQCDAATIKQI